MINSPSSPDAQKETAAQPMTARVVRVAQAGLVVALPDGRKGLVREREIAWQTSTRAAERYRPGDVVTVVPLGRGSDRRPELSIRLAEFDPWRGIQDRYPAGLLVDGEVSGVMSYGVFVDLEPGVTGLLHVSRFPAWAQRPPGELFWPGDLVKVIVDTVDVERRRIGLSMAELSALRWHNQQTLSGLPRLEAIKPVSSNGARPSMDALFQRKPMHVLVVEDEDSQRQAVADWLRYAGQQAETAASAEEALAMIPTLPLDLVLMDIGLPGMDGIKATRQIRDRWPKIRCVLMTDWSRAERRAKEIQPLRQAGVALLIKPLLPEDLLAALLDDTSTVASTQPQPVSPARLQLEQTKPALTAAGEAELGVALARLLTATRADKVVLFELDSEGRQITVAEQRGALPLHFAALPELIHSPVRDVAEGGQIVMAASGAEASVKRFAHLHSLLNFDACLGVPAPAQLRNRYALFLFFARPIAAPEAVLAKAETTAAAVGAWLERRQLIKQTADLNRIAVMGQLTRALVHEISGRLTPVNLTLQRLQAVCSQVEACAAAAPDEAIAVLHQARQELQALAQQAETLARTTRSFGRMARPGEVEIVRLEEIIAEAVDVLSDTAKTEHVTLTVQPAPRLVFTRAQVTQLQQVIVNVVQNAIQQIYLLRPQTGGRVEIRLAQAEWNGQSVLQVSVEDDGPGIHRRLWERVFDMDYTTRPEGSGLGLYLSRRLIESQGGRVFIADSHVLWGSTFVVELPYRT